MSKTNFYLKKPKGAEKTLIYLFFHYNGFRFKYSTGEIVPPKYWNENSQRVSVSMENGEKINALLDLIADEVKKIHREAPIKNINVTNELLKNSLDKILKPVEEIVEKDILYYYNEFLEIQKPTKTLATIKKYKSLLNHLANFQFEKKFHLTFDKIDLKFYDHFTNYCISDLKLLNNTSAKYMKMLKTFLKWANDRGYTNVVTYQKFKVSERDADIIYLTEKELIQISNLNLSKNLKLERVRDIFCFGCYTGLRYSDIARIKKDHIKDDEIRIVSEKTTDRLEIPLNNYAKAILKKYEYSLPVISIQKANDFLKVIGEKAKIKDPIILTKFRGVEEIQIKKPKFELITTHTARRTFVTLSLEKGMRPEMAMSITGHKDYKTFKKYIKITNKVKQAEMKKIWDNEMPILAVV